VVISIALMRPPTLVEPPSVPTRPREAWLAVAALLAGLVHATGLAWHAGEWFAVLPPAAAYAWGLLAGTVADPSLAATVIDRADALAPAAAHPALRAAWLGVACAPGLLTGLILARFGRAGLRGLPWLLVPPAVGAAVLWITGT
jgi:hypothetical protein